MTNKKVAFIASEVNHKDKGILDFDRINTGLDIAQALEAFDRYNVGFKDYTNERGTMMPDIAKEHPALVREIESYHGPDIRALMISKVRVLALQISDERFLSALRAPYYTKIFSST